MAIRINPKAFTGFLVCGTVHATKLDLHAYLGGCFFISSSGLIATCRHCLADLGPNQCFGVILEDSLGRWYPLSDIRRHDHFDFAVGKIHLNETHFPHIYQADTLLGKDVHALGTFVTQRAAGEISLERWLLRGYVTRHGADLNAWPHHSKSVCELSFPSLEGFSGYPVLYVDSRIRKELLLGMLCGNRRSRLESVYSEERRDGQNVYRSSTERSVEFGVAHTASDILAYLRDLEIEDTFR